jgi:hypothetical protein
MSVGVMPVLGPIASPLDPGLLSGGVVGLVQSLLQRVSTDGSGLFDQVMLRFFLRTDNFDPGGGAFTSNHALVRLYGITSGIARAVLALLLVYVAMRTMFEHGYRTRHSLKLMLPQLMLVTVLVQFGLPLIQGAVDLNNAVVERIGLRPVVEGGGMSAWADFLRVDPNGNLVLALLLAVAAVLLVIIGITSVARNVLLILLSASLPLAVLGVLVPEMDSLLDSWKRLFLTTVFSQVAEVMMMRIALLLSFSRDAGFIDAIHGLVAFYLVLKMPTALHAASHAESRAMMYLRHAEHAVGHALTHGGGGTRTARVRAHPAA